MNTRVTTGDKTLLVITALTAVYLLMPSANPSGDALDYACNVRSGEELFMPHHLLYSAMLYAVKQMFSISDTLRLCAVMNALFACGCLLAARGIFRRIAGEQVAAALLLLVGSCYGFMRYAVMGETYIIPLFFSLLGSLFALQQRSAWLVGLAAATACLFHQAHFFWWLGLLFYTSFSVKKREITYYLLASCIVPLVYTAVYHLTPNDAENIWKYVFYDYYYHDDVSFGVSANTLYISPISFVRTFCQFHGYILSLKYTWLLIVIAVALTVSSVKVISSAKRLKDRQKQPFAITHLLIFVMQLLFACGAGSNAEFMVMLPFALLIFLSLRYEAPLKALYLLGGSLFVWNMSAGVIPAHTLELTPEPAVVRYIEANPRMTYCLFDLRTCETMLKYRHPDSQYRLNKGVTEIDSLLRSDGCIISDVWSPRAMSRATLLSSDEESGSAGCIIKRDTVEFSLGKAVMAQVCVCR